MVLVSALILLIRVYQAGAEKRKIPSPSLRIGIFDSFVAFVTLSVGRKG